MKALLDPYVLMVPPIHSPRERIQSYLEALETWLSDDFGGLVNRLYTSECVYQLVENDLFPYHHTISTLLSESKITGYDAYDIAIITSNFFETFEAIEDHLSRISVVSTISIDPYILISRLPSNSTRLLGDCLANIALQNMNSDPLLAIMWILSVENEDIKQANVSIKGTVLSIAATAASQGFPSTPFPIDESLSLLFSREDLLDSLDWTAVWDCPELAIEKAYYSVIVPSQRETFSVATYRVGSAFVETIRGHGFQNQSGRLRSVYETCALVICGYAKHVSGINPRPLKGASRLDGAEGKRANISKRGPGYRLHYWKCPDGSIELSCINVHNDFTIA